MQPPSETTQPIWPSQSGPEPPPNKRRWVRWTLIGAAAVVAVAVIAGTASGGTTTVVKRVPGPTVTVTATPQVTVTQTVSAPPPAPGEKIVKFHGHGNEATPAFNVPDSGNYIVVWSYSGNETTDFGTTSADNFIINNTDDGDGFGLPNDIAAEGSGSTEVTGSTALTARFNVQATGDWTITVKTAD